MKRFTLLLLLGLFTIQGISSQETNFKDNLSAQEAEEYYTMRWKEKRGTARTFLFTGVGLLTAGVIVMSGADDWDEVGGGVLLAGFGTVSSLVSIPFYIKAGSFKRKAKDAMAAMNVSFGTINSPGRKDFSVGLSYSF